MKVDLISFQAQALKELRMRIANAREAYKQSEMTQVVSLQAPTGAGKTIIAASLIEAIYSGITLADGTTFAEQPEAIFVWLSDSPELNEQSKQKIEFMTSKLHLGQCVTIKEESFNCEMLEDGKIYFLNIQKISRGSKLTTYKDNRKYTIWDTMDNTIENKWDHLYFIIDEAHRGAKSVRNAGTDTTIMQRFIGGYEYITEDGIKRFMRAMPVILGISATAERFNTLISKIENAAIRRYVITADEVRSSGLLKDRIAITYPDDPDKDNDMVLLEAAVKEWQKKCIRWHQYTSEQHRASVDPVLVVQVCQGSGGALSNTNLEDVLAKIEEKNGAVFKYGEVVHCFGENAKLTLRGLEIPHVNASEIAGDHKIKVVLFKEALSTGWDCPRAETMMSFAVRNDSTYIAQLLGRMIRTPLQMRISRDEFLNDVKLYLPHFNRDTVKKVIDELQSNEGGEIPTEINGESLAEPTYVTYTVHTEKKKQQGQVIGQTSLFDGSGDDTQQGTQISGGDDTQRGAQIPSADGAADATAAAGEISAANGAPEYLPPVHVTLPVNNGTASRAVPTNGETTGQQETQNTQTQQYQQLTIPPDIDREEIVKFINRQGYKTYLVRKDRINDYLKSLLDLTTLLTHNLIYQNARDEVIDDIIGMMRSYIDDLHRRGSYDGLANQVLEFKLSVQIFDPFGKAIHEDYGNLIYLAETDLDRQVRDADARLGGYGFPNIYGRKYFDEDNPNAHKIDCVLFAADDNCRARLGLYAKNKLHEFVRNYRLKIVNKSDACKKKYHDILADSDIVSEQIFAIPENIVIREDADGKEYDNHLLAAPKTGIAKIKMNGWESALIEEESRRADFVCWLRNPSRGSWALCLPYEKDGEKKAFYPDFLIVRKDDVLEYIVDILEPHGDQYSDNLPKAKALAEYAKKEDRMGRIQLIHKAADFAGKQRFARLDLTDMAVREKVLRANNADELNNIFTTEAKFDD